MSGFLGQVLDEVLLFMESLVQDMDLLRPSSEQESSEASAGPGSVSTSGSSFEHLRETKLRLLRRLLEQRDPLLVPELDPLAPKGHSLRALEGELNLPAGGSLDLLEDMADLGLLRRELHNQIHLCPRCRRCAINFRESCPQCEGIDLRTERLISHFHCAYIGLESEFTHGAKLICPKCHRRLYQVGRDFERPHETYACGTCEYLFEEPNLEGQCLACEHLFTTREMLTSKVFRYRPSELAPRAIELGRLTGLDLKEVLFDDRAQFARREYLLLQTERELVRLQQTESPFSTARLHFRSDGEPYPVFREWSEQAIQQLSDFLGAMHRRLDVIARFDAATIGILLPDANEEGAAAAWDRLASRIGEMSFQSTDGRVLTPALWIVTWRDKKTDLADVQRFYNGDDEEMTEKATQVALDGAVEGDLLEAVPDSTPTTNEAAETGAPTSSTDASED